MATTTPNYNLRKPATTDRVNVDLDISGNMDILDSVVAGKAATGHTHSGTYVGLVAAPGGTDDTAVVQAAINAANAAGGGMVQLSLGTYVCTTLTLYRGVHLVGSGIGGDVFSNTDAGFPFRGTVIKLKNSTNGDLVKTENFAALTGVASPSTYDVPERFSLRHLVLDGNNGNNSSGWPLRIYGRAYRIDDVTVQNGASGGAYTEGPSGGYDMEAKWSNFDIVRCTGVSFDIQGPHDSQYVNGTVKAPGTTPSPTYGIKLSGRVGGEQFTNVHVWGGYTTAHWSLGGTLAQFLACTSDGNGIEILGSGNTWDGLILGASTPGQYAVKLGDGTVRSIGQNHVRGRVTGFKGSPYIVMTPNTTSTGNRFDAVATMGGISRYAAKGNVYTTTGAVAAGAVTVPLSATTDLPASGTLYTDDGTNRTTGLAYTAKTANSITGVTGVPAGGLASGAAVWVESALFGSTDFGVDSFELWDYDNSVNAAGLINRRATPASQGAHLAFETWVGQYYAQEGLVLANPSAGTPSGRILGGSVIPAFSATAGDLYVRTDTSTNANQRIYMCTGGSTWVDIFTLPESAITNLVSDLAAKAPVASPTFTGTTTAPEFSASGLTGATAASRYVGATTAGAPATGTFAVGDFVIDQGGTVWICTTAGSPGTWKVLRAVDPLAAALGLVNWNYNNALGSSGNALTSQRIDAVAIWLPPGVPIATVYLDVTTAGTSTAPTGFFVGLCTTAKQVAQSNNLNASASLTATGSKAFALNATYTTNLADSPSGLYYVTILQNGAFAGTNVVFQRANGSTPGTAPNGGTTFGNIGTLQTALPANGGAVTVVNTAGLAWHVGVA